MAALRAVLGVVAVPFGLVVRLRAAAYRVGLLPSARLPRPVLSVGNLTVGGTGKTPIVEWLAGRLLGKERVVILMRGYASGPDGSDEVGLLRENLPAVRVCQGADRVRKGREALRDGEVDVFILDDGFQHLRLRRDLDIVAIDALCPFGFGRLLPRGYLREPISAIRRAGVVAITRVNQVSPEAVNEIRLLLGRIHPDAAVVEFETVSTLLRDESGAEIAAVSSPLRGSRVLPFSGIGNPESFARSLAELGSDAEPIVFPDHHLYRQEDLSLLHEEGIRRGATAWVTTQKDASKVRRLIPPIPLWVVRVRVRPRAGLEELDRLIAGSRWTDPA